MARSFDTALAGLLDHLPMGWSWTRGAGGVAAKILSPLAAEQARFETYAEQLLTEVDPGAADNLLADYERVLGPDPYGRDLTGATTGTRRAIARQRWTERGGQSIAYFTALAASLGVGITITEKRTARCGAARCGAERCAGTPCQFVWIVTLPQEVVTKSRCGASRCGAASCGSFAINPVEGVIRHDAPAHTHPIFSYTG